MHLTVRGRTCCPKSPGGQGEAFKHQLSQGWTTVAALPCLPDQAGEGGMGQTPQGPGWWTDLLLKASSGGERRCFLQLPGMCCCYRETLLAQEVSVALDVRLVWWCCGQGCPEGTCPVAGRRGQPGEACSQLGAAPQYLAQGAGAQAQCPLPWCCLAFKATWSKTRCRDLRLQ